MDDVFRRYYNEELQYLQVLGGEFAEEFPKIASRLGMQKNIECKDPYVERLLEGFAFLTARVRLKIDSEFPRITRHLLDVVFPNYLNPLPSMAVVEFKPDAAETALVDGFEIPRGSSMLGLLGKDEQTRCDYRSAHAVTLWPIEIREAKYLPSRAALSAMKVEIPAKARAGIALKLGTIGGNSFDKIKLDNLALFLRGSGGIAGLLYEQLIGHGIGYAARSAVARSEWVFNRSSDAIGQLGFDPDEAMLPAGDLAFDPYRLLQEYFAFPSRYMFVELRGLKAVVSQCEGGVLEIIVFLDATRDELVDAIGVENFGLFCTPAVNLFPRRVDRIHLNNRDPEFHVVADRTRPMDFEIWSIEDVRGFGTSNELKTSFRPLYSASDDDPSTADAYYVMNREPRRYSSGQKQRGGSRAKYLGSECFLSLVDANESPYSSELKQLEVQTLCTNRDLPFQMGLGLGVTDFDLQIGAPIDSIRCVSGPSPPRSIYQDGETAWRLINSLSVNYLSLVDNQGTGPKALRDLLKLFCDQNDVAAKLQIESLVSISVEPLTARLPSPGPVTFGRGLDIRLDVDESGFEGIGAFVLGAVLERYFSRYITVNSFCRTSIRSVQRGEMMRWPTRAGHRILL